MMWQEIERLLGDDSGQATAEYALVIIAAATVGLALVAWASGSDVLTGFFDAVVGRLSGFVGG